MATIGKIDLSNGRIYEGEIANGAPNGKGVMKFDDGRIFEGTFIDGVPNGQCKRTSTDGETFEGTFRNGVPNGKCRREWTNGMYLESVYDDGEPVDGIDKCKLIYSDGSYYEGECINGNPQADGWGKQVDSDGSWYEGEWRNGEMHGYCVQKFSDTLAAQAGKKNGWTAEGIVIRDGMRNWWIRTSVDSNNGKPEVLRAADNNFEIPQKDYNTLGINARLFLGFIEMCQERFMAIWARGFSVARVNCALEGDEEIDRQEEKWKTFSEKNLSLPIEQKAEVYYDWLLEKVQTAESKEEFAALAKKFSDIGDYGNCAEIAVIIHKQLENN